MTNFYTADLHLWHRNIIKYSKRPFATVEEMNEELIRRWNSVVGDDDHVHVVGDFSFANKEKTLPIVSRMKGIKHLVPGNHDSQETRRLEGFDGKPVWASVKEYKELNDEGRKVILCHYALRVWNKSHYGSYMLYGHSHGSLPGDSQSLDVGVDCWDYTPVTLDQCIARMKTLKERKPVDHHGK